MADKKGRIKALIKKNVGEIIIRDLKSKATQFVSVSDVEVSPEYSYANIYVTDINHEELDSVVIFLNRKAPFIRSRLAHTLDIYKTPELRFFADKTAEKQEEIDALFAKVTSKPRTLKDVYGQDYKTVDEINAEKALKEKRHNAAMKAAATRKANKAKKEAETKKSESK